MNTIKEILVAIDDNGDKTVALSEISDALNPEFLFQTVHTDLLLQVALKKIDAVEIAKKTLVSRGLDARGRWIGYEQAVALWKVK